ncbi:sentrin-specific protease 1-like [Teratosphaeria destructans]|uniref:Sentrin-specific protease 1-like n=1 Tax=Teratosphaeria destructans TaxID=418781 RepID=A0A9W7STW3_9PEZI|nr:sentrin-specific protease 1-like [Teratosphaeria destructans]
MAEAAAEARELGVDQLRQRLESLEDPAANEEYRQRVNEHITEYRQIRSKYRQRHGVSTITDDFESLFDKVALDKLHDLMLKSLETKGVYKTYQKRLTKRSPWHLSLSDFVFYIAAYDASKDFLCRLHAFSKAKGNGDVNKALPEVLQRRQLRLDPNTTFQKLQTRRVLRRQAWVPQDVLMTAPSNANASSDSEEDDDDNNIEIEIEIGRREHVSTIRGDEDFNAPSDSFCQAPPARKRLAQSTPASSPSRKRQRITPGRSALWRDDALLESSPSTGFAPFEDDSALANANFANGTPSPVTRGSPVISGSVDDNTFQLLPTPEDESEAAAPTGARGTTCKDTITAQAAPNNKSGAAANLEGLSLTQGLIRGQLRPGPVRKIVTTPSAPAVEKQRGQVLLSPEDDDRGVAKPKASLFKRGRVRSQLSLRSEPDAAATSNALATEKQRAHTLPPPENEGEPAATQSGANVKKTQVKVKDDSGSQADPLDSTHVSDRTVQTYKASSPVQKPQQTRAPNVSRMLLPAGAVSDLNRFLPGQWLSDNCIFFAHDAAHGLCQNNKAAIRLLAGGIDLAKPQHKLRVTLKASNKQIAFPVHLPGHWAFGLFDISNRTVQFFDSIGTAYRTRCWEAFQEQVVFQSPKTHTEILPPGERMLEPEPPKDLARQDDAASCGVFACVFGLALAKHQPLPSTLDVPLWRWVLSLLASQSQSWLMLPRSDFGLDQMATAVTTTTRTTSQQDHNLFAIATREAKAFEARARSLQRVLDRLTALQQAKQLVGINVLERQYKTQEEQCAWYKKLVDLLQSAPAGVDDAKDLARARASLEALEEEMNCTEQRFQFLEPVAIQLADLEASLKQQREQLEAELDGRRAKLTETQRVVSDALNIRPGDISPDTQTADIGKFVGTEKTDESEEEQTTARRKRRQRGGRDDSEKEQTTARRNRRQRGGTDDSEEEQTTARRNI